MNKQDLLQQIEKLHQEQSWQAIEQLCTQGLKYFPNNAHIYYYRAVARANLPYIKKAQQDLEKARKLKPDLQEAHLFLQKLYTSLNKVSPSLLFQQENDDLKQLFYQKTSKSVEKIDRYQIIEEIGRGGMGCVYKAYDPQMINNQ